MSELERSEVEVGEPDRRECVYLCCADYVARRQRSGVGLTENSSTKQGLEIEIGRHGKQSGCGVLLARKGTKAIASPQPRSRYYLQHQTKQPVSLIQDKKLLALVLDGAWPAQGFAVRSSRDGLSLRPVSLLSRFGQPSRVISHESFRDNV
jgi:hypothetical protein